MENKTAVVVLKSGVFALLLVCSGVRLARDWAAFESAESYFNSI